MDVTTDIDIDFFDRSKALEDLTYVLASETHENQRQRHQSGVYFHDIPTDPLDGLAVWDYQRAERKGYFKLDFLHNTVYRGVRDEAHLLTLLATDPPWEVLDDPDIVGSLMHIARHYDIIQAIRPRSITDLAVCIALIRPGKTHLIGKPRAEIDQNIWLKSAKFAFKKSHSYSYAAAIIVQLNLLVEQAWSQ
jgi:hypothetical protein